MTSVKTIFVFNIGSSSVKISLFTPSPSSTGQAIPQTSAPIRILTAHAERLNTTQSSIHITLSSNIVSSITTEVQTTNHSAPSKVALHHQDSLQFSTRTSSSSSTTTPTTLTEAVTSSKTKNEKAIHIIEHKEAHMTHEVAIHRIIHEIEKYNPQLLSSVVGVGHRVVHGGSNKKLVDSIVVNDDILDSIRNVSYLAPLHNPKNVLGIEIANQIFNNGDETKSNVPQIAVFDTAFHATMPRFAYTYPIPKEYRDAKIRKYGFHGTSIKYVSNIVNNYLGCYNCDNSKSVSDGSSNSNRIIIAHLGNGSSVTAVVDGKSVDTTMEFTPLSGVMMGTRSGNVDPTIVTFASSQMNISTEEVIHDLNKRSGLMAISNGDSDMRSIERRIRDDDNDELANLAFDMFVYTLSKHIASMLVACGGTIDALVFTAGIGENSSLVRQKVIDRLSPLLGNVVLDKVLNEQNGKESGGIISSQEKMSDDGSSDDNMDRDSCTRSQKQQAKRPLIMVIPTDEEIGIYHECERFVKMT